MTEYQKIDLVGEARAKTQFTFYTIIADDYFINGQSFSNLSAGTNTTSSDPFPVIIDSGYSANILPSSLVDLVYSTFSTTPQLVDIEGSSMFAAACDDEVPSFGIQIDNQVFNLAAQDIMISSMNTTMNGIILCGLGIQPGAEEAGALGDPFLSSVIAVFDIGASEMRFARRAANNYASGSEEMPPDMFGNGPFNSATNSPGDQSGRSCRDIRRDRHGLGARKDRQL